MKENFIKFWNWFENLFFTNHSCVCCSKEIKDGTKFQICENCFKKIELLNGNICERCGDKIAEGNKLCDHCKNFDYSFDESRSFCYYSEISASVVKKLKYGKRKYIAASISEMMLENKAYFENVDVITFVPLHKRRLKIRGFNQAEEIAKIISEKTGVKNLSLFTKLGDGKNQAGLTQKERLENLKGSFEFNKEFLKDVKNKTVLIIDDVFTTGATLNECSKILKKCKPLKIKTMTFAKTKFEHEK